MRHPYADFIDQVQRPARYLGGEYLSVVKPAESVDARVVLAFPDVYDIGMSHLGTKILYSLLNKHPRIAAERCFAPWVDMEAELRRRELPLLSLESHAPLADFDVVGISLQYELTYTNVLTLLDLGGIALRAADRADDAPLVLGGGPTATHPEPVAPFFDAFFVGEAEEALPELVLAWAAMRRARRPRLDALAELAARFPLYVPALYDLVEEDASGALVVGRPRDPRAPARVSRAMVADLDRFPFPTDTPVPYAEAVFDRSAVEIARGCTEGCRFCQAGMIYRPVRERDPVSIVDSVLGGLRAAGHDEASLTCLSTADVSYISPLIKRLMGELRGRKVSLSVSSLRAYGLSEELLDELASVRATGLTFAPEAGTQRMRDVVNKNVTEAHIEESANRVFRRGWHRLKLYFMIGLPTEADDDVRGILATGARMLAVGRGHIGRKAEVTVSVSSHVPKPHTPFQWCAMDPQAELERKQALLRQAAVGSGVRLKYHDAGISFVEGVMARGDRRVADAVELAWRRGARFDGWDELFDLGRWQQVFADVGLALDRYLGTLPVRARLPWDHIDVGLEDGFLLSEYRAALKDRLSLPCGKPAGTLLHHTNVDDAAGDGRKLVCFDCGVACDMSAMRADRIVKLERLGALARPAPRVVAPVPAPMVEPPDEPTVEAPRKRRKPQPRATFAQGEARWYRVRYTKLGRAAFLSHLDLVRVLARLLRRAGLEVAYSRGFHPKPLMELCPALSLGIPALGELCDLALDRSFPASDLPPAELAELLRQVAPEGIEIRDVVDLPPGPTSLARRIDAFDLAVQPAADGIGLDEARLARIAATFLARDHVPVVRGDATIDVRSFVRDVDVIAGAAAAALSAALDWTPAPAALLRVRVLATASGSAKPREVARALGVWGDEDPRAVHARVARLGFWGLAEGGAWLDPLAPAPAITTLIAAPEEGAALEEST